MLGVKNMYSCIHEGRECSCAVGAQDPMATHDPAAGLQAGYGINGRVKLQEQCVHTMSVACPLVRGQHLCVGSPVCLMCIHVAFMKAETVVDEGSTCV